MDKVHGITTSWLRGLGQGDPGHRRSLLPSSPSKREPFVTIIEPFHLLVIHRPAFPSQPDIDPGTPIPPFALRNLTDPCAEHDILLPPTTISQRVPIEGQ